jgi:hypothetical protein
VLRQEALDDPNKEFHFVVPETLLRNILVVPDQMPTQLARLGEVAGRPNVHFGIIRMDVHWPYPPYHGFSLLDDKHVVIDLYNTIVVTQGKSDITLYRQVFDALEAAATQDIEPILEEYRGMYLTRAQESSSRLT